MRIYGAFPSLAPAALIGTGIPAPVGAAASVDLRQYCAPIEDQIGSSCVGHAIADAHFVAKRGASARISARGIYVSARARARRAIGDALPDNGCYPGDAFDALVATGAYKEDARDFDPAQLNSLETWGEEISAKRFVASDLVPIADGDLSSLDRWLTYGAAVHFIMQVDEGYESLSGTTVYTGPTGKMLGGHAQCFVGFTSSVYIVCNSWGTLFGYQGYAYMARDFVRTSCTELVAVRNGPVFQ